MIPSATAQEVEEGIRRYVKETFPVTSRFFLHEDGTSILDDFLKSGNDPLARADSDPDSSRLPDTSRLPGSFPDHGSIHGTSSGDAINSNGSLTSGGTISSPALTSSGTTFPGSTLTSGSTPAPASAPQSAPDASMIKGPWAQIMLPFRPAPEGWILPFQNLRTIPCFRRFTPHRHQILAFERLDPAHPRSTIVATGTGSGKTECFLYPILEYCLAERKKDHHGIKALLIYPMNALVENQGKRLASLIHEIFEATGIQLTAGNYTGDSSFDGFQDMGADHVITHRGTMEQDPPDILLTNYKMLDLLLLRPESQGIWQADTKGMCRYLVVDELHTFDGAQGSDLSCLIRRFREHLDLGQDLACVGTSATAGEDPRKLREFASLVFGAPFLQDPASVIAEDRLDPEEFLRKYGAGPVMGQWPMEKILQETPPENSMPAYIAWVTEAWFPWENIGFNSEDSELDDGPCLRLGECLPFLTGFRELIRSLNGTMRIHDLARQWYQRNTGYIRDFVRDHVPLPPDLQDPASSSFQGSAASSSGAAVSSRLPGSAASSSGSAVSPRDPSASAPASSTSASRLTPEAFREEQGILLAEKLITGLLAMVSAARVREAGNQLKPFLNVRCQLWIRSLVNLLATLDRHHPRLLLAADRRRQDPLALPLVCCQSCGMNALGGSIGSLGSARAAVSRDNRRFYQDWFSHDDSAHLLLPLKDMTDFQNTVAAMWQEEGEPRDVPWLYREHYALCTRCDRLTGIREKADLEKIFQGKYNCPGCASTAVTAVRIPEITERRSTPEGSRTRRHDLCPCCGAENSLIIAGARVPTLTSRVADIINGGIFSGDSRMVAFSDSVQDAAMNAGFTGARNWRHTMSRALLQYVRQKLGNSGRLTMLEAMQKVAGHWEARFKEAHRRDPDREILASADFAASLFPAPLIWRREWRRFKAAALKAGSPKRSQGSADDSNKSGWQSFLQFLREDGLPGKGSGSSAGSAASGSPGATRGSPLSGGNALQEGTLGTGYGGTLGRLVQITRERMSWELLKSFTLDASLPWSLPGREAAAAAPDPMRLSGAVRRAQDLLRNDCGLELTGEGSRKLAGMIQGLIRHMLSQGGVSYRALETACPRLFRALEAHYEKSSSYLLTKSASIFRGSHGRLIPRGLTMSASGARNERRSAEAVLQGKSDTWHTVWLRKYLQSLNDPMIRPDRVDPAGFYRQILMALEEQHLTISVTRQSGEKIWLLDPAGLIITSRLKSLTCPRCRRHYLLPEEAAEALRGLPCPGLLCAGSLEIPEDGELTSPHATDPADSHGRLRRIHATEHTALLSGEQRKTAEESFAGEDQPWSLNLISATPTLEMGIDIGALSTVIMCNVPPTQASYAQRLGRGGRRDGNSLAVTIADGRAHDQYFWSDPESMIAGEIRPPGVFLQAASVLERQFTAFALGIWIRERLADIRKDPGSSFPSRNILKSLLPHDLSATIQSWTRGDHAANAFPLGFLDWLRSHAADLCCRFRDAMEAGTGIETGAWANAGTATGKGTTTDAEADAGARADSEVRTAPVPGENASPAGSPARLTALPGGILDQEKLDYLMAYARGDLADGENSLRSRLAASLSQAEDQQLRLKASIDELDRQIKEVQNIPDLAAEEKEKEKTKLERERAVLHRIRTGERQKNIFSWLTDAGLLPNYAFPEDGVKVNAAVINHNDLDEQDRHDRQQSREDNPPDTFSFARSAHMSLRALAPGMQFFALGHRFTIDRVSLELPGGAKGLAGAGGSASSASSSNAGANINTSNSSSSGPDTSSRSGASVNANASTRTGSSATPGTASGEILEHWRICPDCSHIEREDIPDPLAGKSMSSDHPSGCCPACGCRQYGDLGQRLTLVRIRELYARADGIGDLISDDRDERRREPHTVILLPAWEQEDVITAWKARDPGTTFGMEFLRRIRITEINLGPKGFGGRQLSCAGEELGFQGFTICRHCGAVLRRDAKDEESCHAPFCRKARRAAASSPLAGDAPGSSAARSSSAGSAARNVTGIGGAGSSSLTSPAPASAAGNLPDQDPWLRELGIYRQFASEAVRIRLPVSALHEEPGNLLRILFSLKAALRLGLERHFKGDVSHLQITVMNEPCQDSQGEEGERSLCLLLYDTVPGGSGYLKDLTRKVGRDSPCGNMAALFQETYEALISCRCRELGQDGCWRCVLHHSSDLERPHVSRITAERMIRQILGLLSRGMEDLAGESISRHAAHTDSPLEDQFLDRLLREFPDAREDHGAAPAGCRSCWHFTVPADPAMQDHLRREFGRDFRDGFSWRLLTQRHAEGDHASVPDFVLIPEQESLLRTRPDLEMQIFTDGWRFHREIIREDLLKRQSLLNRGSRIWSLTWEDVTGEETAGEGGKHRPGDGPDPAVPEVADLLACRHGSKGSPAEATQAARAAVLLLNQIGDTGDSVPHDPAGVTACCRELSQADHGMGLLLSWIRDPLGTTDRLRAGALYAALNGTGCRTRANAPLFRDCPPGLFATMNMGFQRLTNCRTLRLITGLNSQKPIKWNICLLAAEAWPDDRNSQGGNAQGGNAQDGNTQGSSAQAPGAAPEGSTPEAGSTPRITAPEESAPPLNDALRRQEWHLMLQTANLLQFAGNFWWCPRDAREDPVYSAASVDQERLKRQDQEDESRDDHWDQLLAYMEAEPEYYGAISRMSRQIRNCSGIRIPEHPLTDGLAGEAARKAGALEILGEDGGLQWDLPDGGAVLLFARENVTIPEEKFRRLARSLEDKGIRLLWDQDPEWFQTLRDLLEDRE